MFSLAEVFQKNARKSGVGRGQFEPGVNGLNMCHPAVDFAHLFNVFNHPFMDFAHPFNVLSYPFLDLDQPFNDLSFPFMNFSHSFNMSSYPFWTLINRLTILAIRLNSYGDCLNVSPTVYHPFTIRVFFTV